MLIVIAYDIEDARRRRRLASIMEDYGARQQKSVFECLINQEKVQELVRKIKAVINRRKDKVHIYFVCQSCRERTTLHGQNSMLTDSEVFIW